MFLQFVSCQLVSLQSVSRPFALRTATLGLIGGGLALTLQPAFSLALFQSSSLAPNSRLISQSQSQSQSTAPQQQKLYQIQGVSFEAPEGFSEVQPLGNQTVGIIFPATAEQTRHVAVRLMELTPAALGLSSLTPSELSEYARFRFFGITTRPQSSQTRRFFGQAVTGEVLLQPTRNGNSYIEFYLVPLSLQRHLAIAFETDTELPVSILEQTIQTITHSLKDIPPKKKRR